VQRLLIRIGGQRYTAEAVPIRGLTEDSKRASEVEIEAARSDFHVFRFFESGIIEQYGALASDIRSGAGVAPRKIFTPPDRLMAGGWVAVWVFRNARELIPLKTPMLAPKVERTLVSGTGPVATSLNLNGHFTPIHRYEQRRC
jgi:hypothetical protein